MIENLSPITVNVLLIIAAVCSAFNTMCNFFLYFGDKKEEEKNKEV